MDGCIHDVELSGMEQLCSEALKVSNCMPQASEFHWTQSQKRRERTGIEGCS